MNPCKSNVNFETISINCYPILRDYLTLRSVQRYLTNEAKEGRHVWVAAEINDRCLTQLFSKTTNKNDVAVKLPRVSASTGTGIFLLQPERERLGTRLGDNKIYGITRVY